MHLETHTIFFTCHTTCHCTFNKKNLHKLTFFSMITDTTAIIIRIITTPCLVQCELHSLFCTILCSDINFFRILLSMEVFEIHGLHNMYWNEEGSNLFLAMNLRKIMSCTRLREIATFLQPSFDQDHNQPGSDDTLDKINHKINHFDKIGSMIKSFHRNLTGKIKIIWKQDQLVTR